MSSGVLATAPALLVSSVIMFFGCKVFPYLFFVGPRERRAQGKRDGGKEGRRERGTQGKRDAGNWDVGNWDTGSWEVGNWDVGNWDA